MASNVRLMFCKHGVAAEHLFEARLQRPMPACLGIIAMRMDSSM